MPGHGSRTHTAAFGFGVQGGQLSERVENAGVLRRNCAMLSRERDPVPGCVHWRFAAAARTTVKRRCPPLEVR